MASDLPDYTLYVTHNINVPEASTGQVNVLRYALVPVDLVDGARGPILGDIKGRPIIKVLQDSWGQILADVRARPKGALINKGNETTTASYATIATRTITTELTFQLAKIVISCPEDIMYRLRFNEAVISAEVYVAKKTPFTDWFPWDYYAMLGDGSKTFDIQAKFPTGGAAADCHAEIVGEEY